MDGNKANGYDYVQFSLLFLRERKAIDFKLPKMFLPTRNNWFDGTCIFLSKKIM